MEKDIFRKSLDRRKVISINSWRHNEDQMPSVWNCRSDSNKRKRGFSQYNDSFKRFFTKWISIWVLLFLIFYRNEPPEAAVLLSLLIMRLWRNVSKSKKKSFYLRVRIRQSLPVWAQPGPEESPGKHLTYWTHLFIESYKAVKTAFWKCLGLYTWQSAAYYGLFTNTAIICHYVFMPNSVRCQTLI